MTTTGSRSPSATFSGVLRERSRADHDRAETSGFMAALLDGQLDRSAYAELTAQLFFVYETLEAAAEAMRDDPVAGPFVCDELRRSPALESDLRNLLGADWRAGITAGAATRQYCDRIREVGFSWPGGFVAHHYTRYLGDLSGGQVIGAIVRRVYDLSDRDGAAFYDFGAIPNRNEFKESYRARLDAAPWDADEQTRIVDEILAAYAYNVALLAELDDHIDLTGS